MFELGKLEHDTLAGKIRDIEIPTREDQYDSDQHVAHMLDHLSNSGHTDIDFDESGRQNILFPGTHSDDEFQENNILFINFFTNIYRPNHKDQSMFHWHGVCMNTGAENPVIELYQAKAYSEHNKTLFKPLKVALVSNSVLINTRQQDVFQFEFLFKIEK